MVGKIIDYITVSDGLWFKGWFEFDFWIYEGPRYTSVVWKSLVRNNIGKFV